MNELITAKEVAARLGVSDMAVYKAVKANRIFPAETGGKIKQFEWPQVKSDWIANTNEQHRTHTSAGRTQSTHDGLKSFRLPDAKDREKERATVGEIEGEGRTYAESRAAREHYLAELARLEFEEREKMLIKADEVKAAWFKHITAAKTRILGIPASCKSRRSDLPLEVVALIESICREALDDLAGGSDD